jgi:hypothetical protein
LDHDAAQVVLLSCFRYMGVRAQIDASTAIPDYLFMLLVGTMCSARQPIEWSHRQCHTVTCRLVLGAQINHKMLPSFLFFLNVINLTTTTIQNTKHLSFGVIVSYGLCAIHSCPRGFFLRKLHPLSSAYFDTRLRPFIKHLRVIN